MIRALYLRLHDRLFRHPGWLLGCLCAAAAVSASAVPKIGLDMSFRPLFGQDEAELEATHRFEERFGQRSGAFIGAVVTPGPWTPSFLEALAVATEDVADLDHVVEVVSLARAGVADWTADTARSRWLVEPGAFEGVSGAEWSSVRALRNDAGLARTLFSADGERTLLLARLDLPLEDLRGRAGVIRALQKTLDARLGPWAELHWVGISVVEVAYARLVLSGLALSLALTTLTLLTLLLVVFRRPAAVAAIMAGVSLALPVSLGVMVVRGQGITIVNSMVPTMIMIIGVADAIHMFESFAGHVRGGSGRRAAVRAMFGDMALPCLLTALTTAAGLLALEAAEIAAIRDFGSNVAVGIGVVYVANLLALPSILLLVTEGRLLAERGGRSPVRRWTGATARVLTHRPGWVVAASAGLILCCAVGVGRMEVDQRFNEEVARDHPVRVSQSLYEREFTGILGPDVVIRRLDGGSMLGTDDRRRLADLVASFEALPGVIHVESVLDHLPGSVDGEQARAGLLALRTDPGMGRRLRDLLDARARRTVVVVHTADVGSRASLELVERIEAAGARLMGDAYEVQVVGQWWLAQLGLSNILGDMLASFGTSFALVLPLLAIALGSARLFSTAVLPNLLPPLFALGLMGWTGISARVGTAMVLAIALAIAVDDTIHILVRLKEEARTGVDPGRQVRAALEHAGGPVLLTTVVLVAGFLSMRVNGLLAIQDMGVVAAATLLVALLADIYFLPASYLLLARRGERRDREPTARRPEDLRAFGAPPTCPDVSAGDGSKPRLVEG